jgi:carboxypeptidase family protein
MDSIDDSLGSDPVNYLELLAIRNVADATVKVTDPAKQLERQVTTNSDGHFILPQLPPSRYKWMTLTFEMR